MQSITSMVPVWQRGHSRSDCGQRRNGRGSQPADEVAVAGTIPSNSRQSASFRPRCQLPRKPMDSDAVKPVRQHMDQKAGDELLTRER